MTVRHQPNIELWDGCVRMFASPTPPACTSRCHRGATATTPANGAPPSNGQARLAQIVGERILL